MVQFLLRYAKVLLALLLAFGLYSVTLVPAIEPLPQTTQARPAYSPMLGVSRWWIGLFPQGEWQTQNPKIINTDRGILLSESWEPIDAKTWRLKPLTMILPHSKSARKAVEERQTDELVAEDMWIISAEDGATIHFEHPLDLTSGNVPTVVRGDLQGEIEVTRKAANSSIENDWKIRTYDMRIDRRKLETDKQVRIDWNDSVIEGRELKILLRGDLLGNQGTESSNWGPLDELELYHVDKVDIGLPAGGIWANMSLEKLDEDPAIRTLPARLNATCRGRFTFDFRRSTASLQDGVRLEHKLGTLPPDEFLCERVLFELEPPKESVTSTESTNAGAVQIKRIEATGVDALRETVDSQREFVGEKWVNFHAPTVDLELKAKHLSMDMTRNRLELAGRINRPNATQSIVVVKYLGNEIRAPNIDYQPAPKGEGEESKHLGLLFADGPGQIRTTSEYGQEDAEIRWQKSLRMKPAPHSNLVQWIELVGNTFIESKKYGFLTSDRLELWLKKSPESEQANGTRQADDLASSYQPERVFSTGRTVVANDRMRAEVQESLDLAFIIVPAVTAPAQNPNQLAMNDSVGNPMYQWVAPPQENQPKQPGNSQTNDEKSIQDAPMVVTGKTLQASVVTSGEDGWIDHLQLNGPVEIRQESTKADTPPWRITGDRLALATDRQGDADIQIDGLPARILVADGALLGKTIRVDQKQNLIWMNDPGEFKIPLNALNKDNSDIQWFNAPYCKWQGTMQFDGKVVEITGDIEYEGGLSTAADQFWLLKGRSDILRIHLESEVKFADTSPNDSIRIAHVELERNVNIFASEVDSKGDVRSREQVSVPLLTVHALENKFVGTGPGWVKSNYLSRSPLARADTASTSQDTSDLQGLHLRFRDSMVGFMDRREVIFEGKVEVGVSPIVSWDQLVNVDLMHTLSQDQMLLNCDQLKMYDTSNLNALYRPASLARTDSPESWEFKATGNVAFNGVSDSGDFSGSGYQVTYVQSKDFLLLKGDGRTAAKLSRKARTMDLNDRMGGDAEMFVRQVGIYPKTLNIEGLQLAPGGINYRPGNQPNNGFPEQQPPPGNLRGTPNLRPNLYGQPKQKPRS